MTLRQELMDRKHICTTTNGPKSWRSCEVVGTFVLVCWDPERLRTVHGRGRLGDVERVAMALAAERAWEVERLRGGRQVFGRMARRGWHLRLR